MDPFHRLLVPLDGSSLAEAVLPATAVIAGRLSADVVLLHILEEGAPETVHGDRHLTDLAEAETYLEETAGELRRRGLRVETHTHPEPESNVAESISRHASRHEADVVVLATHGWGGLREVFLGTIAQQVLNAGDRPVLLIKPTSTGDAPRFEGTCLAVPLDGSPVHDNAVLPVAAMMARALTARLELVMVVPTSATLRSEHSAPAVFLPSASRQALKIQAEEATERLATVARQLQEEGLAADSRLLRGDPATQVLRAAKGAGADLIVLSTHGRAGWDAFWAGSVGAKILRRLTQPLLMVRVPRDDEEDTHPV